MTIATENNRTAELATDGVETTFDFSMLIHADTEVQVWYAATGDDYAQLTLDTDYTVVFTEDGGTVTTIGGSSPYAAGKILIIRHLVLTQQTNWLFNDNHTGPQHEDDFDRAVMRDLQIQEQLDRCVGFNITSETENIEFPEPLSDNIIGWNTAGDALENKAGVTGIVLLPATDGNFIVGDGTAWIVESGATARASLGLTIGSDVQAWSANLDSIDQDLGTGDSPTFTGLTLSSLTDTRVLFAGASGVISDDAGLTYALATDILTAGTYNATDEDNILQVDADTILRTGTAANNLFLGCGVFASDEGIDNIGIGFQAGFNNSHTTGDTGRRNVYIGSSAGYGNTAGVDNTGHSNFALGESALYYNTSGFNNVALGFEALRQNTSGHHNLAIGDTVLSNNTLGTYNVGIGQSAGTRNTSGDFNIFIGHAAGTFTKTGDSNVVIGRAAGFGVEDNSYSNNILIGFNSGVSLSTGSDNIFIGFESGFNQTTTGNLLIIDNQDRGSIAAELTDALIYGIFSATPASQSLRFNVGTTTWHNATHEDTDGGRESIFDFKGQQSGGEETTLARIEVSHDGAADDQKGKIILSTNDGDDSDTPTDHIEIDAAGNTKIGDAGTTNYTQLAADGSVSQVGTARIDWTKITANAVSIENAHGVITGAVATLQTAHDGSFLEVAEEAETPGIEFLVDFVSVTAFNWVNIIGFYDANTTTHAIAIQLYNWTQTRWDTFDSMQKEVGDITTADGYILGNHDFIVPADTEYIGTAGDAGKVRVRFYHTMGGAAAHDLRLDVVALYQ